MNEPDIIPDIIPDYMQMDLDGGDAVTGGRTRTGVLSDNSRLAMIGREAEPPPDDTTVVVRGGVMHIEDLRRNVLITLRRHGFAGISVFAAVTASTNHSPTPIRDIHHDDPPLATVQRLGHTDRGGRHSDR